MKLDIVWISFTNGIGVKLIINKLKILRTITLLFGATALSKQLKKTIKSTTNSCHGASPQNLLRKTICLKQNNLNFGARIYLNNWGERKVPKR